MELRFAEGRYELFPDLAAELVRLKVDVIVLGSRQQLVPCTGHVTKNQYNAYALNSITE